MRKRKGNRSLLELWPGGECSHLGARQGGRSHCWPVPGGAVQFFLPPQPAGRVPGTMLCYPLSSRAWRDSLQTGLCSALALEGRQQRPLISQGKGISQLALQACLSNAAPCISSKYGLCDPVTYTTANYIQKVRGMRLGWSHEQGEIPAVMFH